FFQSEDGIRDRTVTGVQTCALPICEIGIRMALGAHRKDVFALIMRQGALQTALAVFVGLLLSLAAGRVLAQILYQVSPSDPFARSEERRVGKECRYGWSGEL